MLVCPHCQFENPSTNKFCQECGESLTQNQCPDCGSSVPVEVLHCQECGAISGLVWWALMVEDGTRSSQESNPVGTGLEPTHLELEVGFEVPGGFESSTSEVATTEARTAGNSVLETATTQEQSLEASSLSERELSKNQLSESELCREERYERPEGHRDEPYLDEQYLDEQHRYRLLEVPAPEDDRLHERYARVIDCQPFQRSPLEALEVDGFASHLDGTSDATTNADKELLNPITQDSNNPDELMALVLPPIAQPYLALRHRFYQALPILHDAWQQQGQQVLLLEDRSHFPFLVDLWLNSDVSLSFFQILHWLYEMAELWGALEPWSCQQSLLEVANLRIDEDQNLCLQRLFTNDATPISLRDLGQLWQTLFAESQRTQFQELSLLLSDLDMGKVTSVEMLQTRIEVVAQTLQTQDSSVESGSDPFASDLPLTTPPIELPNPSATESNFSPVTQPPVELQRRTSTSGEDEGDNDPTIVLPMQLFNLEDVGRTDIGRQRQHNEDYFGMETQVSRRESPSGKTLHARNFYVLCDGMGGQADGEVASALAVDILRRFFKENWQSTPWAPGADRLPESQVLYEAVQRANKAIYDVNQQNARSGSGRMGTTLVMVLVQDTEVAIAHVGDSRLYRYTRKRGLEQLTVDHEVGQREIQRGVEPDVAYARPDAYQLTQALGPRDEQFVKPDIQYLELNEDALLLLCSDGLTDNNLLETYCQSHIEPLLSSQTNLEQGVCKLIELANQVNGHDNITALVIRVKVRPNLANLR